MLVANALCWFCRDVAHFCSQAFLLMFYPSSRENDNVFKCRKHYCNNLHI
jgi:hypothetical protein